MSRSTIRIPSKVTAVAFALLMLVPATQFAVAEHTTGGLPGAPGLPHAKVGDQCIPVGVDSTILEALQAVQNQDGSYFASNKTVPSLCGPNNVPVSEYGLLIREADRILDEFRNTSTEIERQADARFEQLYPEAGIAKPTVSLFSDRFDGRALGGFGDWTVVTESGGEPTFQTERIERFEGKVDAWRFGDNAGYLRGTREFLVSPEIDMRAIRGNDDDARRLAASADRARTLLYDLCFGPLPDTRGVTNFDLSGGRCQVSTGDSEPVDVTLVRAYEQAVDAVLRQAPVAKPIAELTLEYWYNFADTLQDGVRVYAYVGDYAPDRLTLYSPKLGDKSQTQDCGQVDPDRGSNPSNPAVVANFPAAQEDFCAQDRLGASLLPLPRMDEISSFRGTNAAPALGVTGRTLEPVTATLDMSDFAGKRVWLLFEAATYPDRNSGGDYFKESFRKDSERFGFELSSVELTGEAWPRNVRTHEVTYPPVLGYRNDQGSLIYGRTAVPPGDEHVSIPVHNAGAYTENATLKVDFFERAQVNTQNLGVPNATKSFAINRLAPGEVRTIDVLWPMALKDGKRYDVRSSLVVEDMTTTQGTAPTDPKTTNVRIPNYAQFDSSGRNTLSTVGSVDAILRHGVAAYRATGSGYALEVCGSLPGNDHVCDGLYAAEKGKPRFLQVGVRNEGTRAETIVATLHLSLDGLDKTDSIKDSPAKTLTDVSPAEGRIVTWSLALNEPGIYRAFIAFTLADGTTLGEPVERLLYVQQTTGLLCFDNLYDERACGPSFTTEKPGALGGRAITAAAVTADGRLIVATRVDEANGGLYARGTDGEWTQLESLSNASLVNQFGEAIPATGAGSIRQLVVSPTGALFLVGDNGTMLARGAQGGLTILSFENATRDGNTHLVDAAWFANTLQVVGGGRVFALNGTKLEWVNVTRDGESIVGFRTIAANATRAYVGGDYGLLMRHNGTAWNAASNPDAVLPNGDVCSLVARTGALCERNITDITFAADRAIVVGAKGLILGSVGADAFAIINPVPSTTGAPDLKFAFGTHLGDLFLVGSEGRFFACEVCTTATAFTWRQPAVSFPYVADPVTGQAVLAVMTASASNDKASYVLGTGGTVLRYAFNGFYDNREDWTTVPSLLPTLGGLVETSPSLSSIVAWRISPELADQGDQSTLVRVSMTHHVIQATEAQVTVARFVDTRVPTNSISTTSDVTYTCPPPRAAASASNVMGGAGDAYGSATCKAFVAANVEVFNAPTRNTSGISWVKTVKTVDLAAAPRTENSAPRNIGALSFELVSSQGARWSVDDVVIERVSDGKVLMSYFGPDAPVCSDIVTKYCNKGAYGTPLLPALNVDTSGWVQRKEEAADLDTNSAWHLSQSLADRPVWVANDEQFYNNPRGADARLRDNWNSRLLSPVVDLTDAFDPVVSFNHLYAFRLYASTPATGAGTLQAAEGGYVEVQYLKKGIECQSADPEFTCWSDFFKLVPEGGYPKAIDLGFKENVAISAPGSSPPVGVEVGPNVSATQPGASYWGRIASPDEQGIIRDVAQTEKYVPARFHLDPATQPNLDVNLTGRYVRIAFHLATFHSTTRTSTTFSQLNATNVAGYENPRSFAREGWYVTDLKVQGANQLGIDLRAGDLRFPVGYDVKNVGIGPGERVPINLTVSNRGVFETLGYTVNLEIDRVLDPVLARTERIETLHLGQQAVLDPSGSRNHTFFWNVPTGENLNYTIRAIVTPIGIARDEDPTDNVARLGTIGTPVKAITTRAFHIDFSVSPENATADITRYVPIFLNNTGNVPLAGIDVSRDITILSGPTTRVIESNRWHTDRPVPAGTRVSLALLSDTFDPVQDLFWKAPERSNFKAVVNAVATDVGLRAQPVDKTISAFATYFFDDVEGGPRGESSTGSWTLDSQWAPATPGAFQTHEAYTFGDVGLNRYPADADSSAISPEIDLANARSARLAFYHRYNFESGFDAGILEATIDGGRTWTPITPVADLLNKLERGYNNDPISPASPLHTTGNPERAVYGYTGASADLPSAVEGWVLTQFDLTDYQGITRAGVPYETLSVDAFENGDYGHSLLNNRLTYTDGSWKTGAVEDFEYWEVQNLTENRIRSVAGNDTFWWSGSASLADDNRRPIQNMLLEIPVDLTGYAPGGDVVEVDWWEWSDRTGMRGLYLPPIASTFKAEHYNGAFTWSKQVSQTWRMNVTQPTIVEKNGQWLHLKATLDDAYKGKEFNLTFAYSPVRQALTDEITQGDRLQALYIDDLGFAIDGFNVKSYRVVNGEVTGQVAILSEADAWARSQRLTCTTPYSSTPNPLDIPCYNRPSTRFENRQVVGPASTMDSWRLQTTIGNLSTPWTVIPVRDENDNTLLPTGGTIRAFYSGNTICANTALCYQETGGVRPLAESRLVTPNVDLGIVAGDSVDLTFWHRYAFLQEDLNKRNPQGNGGVVEIQVFDDETGTWGEWKQIYSGTGGGLYAFDSAGNPLIRDPTILTRSPNLRYGYSAYTANETNSTSGPTYRLDPPFEPRLNDQYGKDFQFYYSGNSGTLEGASPRGWVQETYPVSEFIGKKVRFGFHYAMSGLARSQTTTCLPEPGSACQSGWWIREVEVSGKVLAGDVAQFRLRSATDGNVQEGFWQVDDIGLFGARYQRNVGVFVNETPRAYGALDNMTVTIPVTVRNLGSTVRTGLGVEILQLSPQLPTLTLGSTIAGASPDSENANLYRIPNIDLGPGASTTINVTVTTPADLAVEGQKTMLVFLREFNPAANKYTAISDNEVQGFLESELKFGLERKALAAPGATSVTPAKPNLGDIVEMRVPVQNTGFAELLVNVTCAASTVDMFRPIDHSKAEISTFTTAATYPCTLGSDTQSTTRIAPGDTATLTFRARPIVAGVLRFDVTYTAFDGRLEQTNLAPIVGTMVVGNSPVVFETVFPNATAINSGNWTGSVDGAIQPRFSMERGKSAPGALLVGPDDSTGPTNAKGAYLARSPIVDLRNLTSGAYLTFWHLDRMAIGDGAQVKAEILMKETSPGSPASWQPLATATGDDITQCVLTPREGYEGVIRAWASAPGDQPSGVDANPGRPPADGETGYMSTSANYFITPSGIFENEWDFEVIDLTTARCNVRVNNQDVSMPLLGHQVRFYFVFYGGDVGGQLGRTASNGIYIDDITVGPLSLEVRPGTQKRILLDNTTKTFNILVTNHGVSTDLVQVELDAANSSTPVGAINAPTEPLTIKPGETRIVPITVTLPRDPSLLPTVFEANIRAKSLFDLNARGSSRFELVFAPRQWADLGLSITAPTKATQEGTEAFIPLVVENNGLVNSVDTSVRIRDTWVQNGVTQMRETTLDLPAMSSFFQNADDSTRVVEFRWRPEKGSIGEHTLDVVVDPQALGQEYTRSDNVGQIKAQVTKLLVPDISLASDDTLTLRNAVGAPVSGVRDADVTRYQVTAGELVGFDVRVRNLGAGGVTNVDIRTFLGQLSLPAKTVPYIAPGGEVTLRFNWISQKGDYPLEIVARSEQVEVSTANNRYPGTGVTILTVKGYEVSALALLPGGLIEPGTEVPFALTLRNAGNAGEELDLRADLPQGWQVRFDRPTIYLRSEETFESSGTLIVPQDAVAGEQFINILAVSRENPMKVAASKTPVDVRAYHEGRIDAVVTRAAPPTFALPVHLVNEGNSRTPWIVNLQLPAGWTTVEALPARIIVPPHGETTYEFHVRTPSATTPGARDILVNATLGDGSIREGSTTVDLLQRRGAELRLIGDGKGIDGAIAFTVDVSNKGNVKKPFSVVLLDVPAGLDARVEPSTFDLAPGMNTTARLIVTPADGVLSGTYALSTYALFDGVHPDTAEGRANRGDHTVAIMRPDLQIVNVEQAPRTDIKEGERVVIKTTIANRGATPVSNLPVHLYVDDVFIIEARLESLAPGQVKDILVEWTAIRGEHTLTVVVDPYRDSVDTTREDNTVSLLTKVNEGSPLGAVAADRLNTPGPGIAGLIFALAAAMVVSAILGRRRPNK